MTNLRKIAAVVNPHSAGGKTGREWPAIAEKLKRRAGPFTVRFTDSPGAGTALARQLIAEGFDFLIAVGGDGTANEVANGILESGNSSDVCFGLIPTGTGGDFRRSLGMPNNPDGAVEVLISGEPRPIDVGKVTYRDFAGETVTRYFINLLSFGMGGEVAARARNVAGALGGRAAFLWASLKGFAIYRGKHVRLILDGKDKVEAFVTDITVGNGCFYGGGMNACPTATLDDGIFEVTVIDYMNLFQFLREVPPLYSGNIYRRPKGHHFRARHLRAEAETEVKIQIDGEPLGTLPLDITILPGKLLVPVAASGRLAKSPAVPKQN
jgi:YegS/Rv2252/BmrU family lipid kinase